MSYKRSDYGKNPHAGRARNNAEARGWGTGWPKCQTSKLKTVAKAGVRVPVRGEIADLVAVLLQATEKLGYDVKSGQTWGFACRAIRGTQTASNHSWGLAVDINSLSNPMSSTFKSDIPPAVVKMWEASGFYWGGRYENRPDSMHFEYIFKPGDVAGHLKKAKTFLSGDTPSTPSAPPSKYETYRKGVQEGSRTLKEGSAGDDVKELQRILNAWYPSRPDLKLDGYFGPATEAAVKHLQTAAKIKVDGIVGPQTWGTLRVTSGGGGASRGYTPPPFPTGIAPNRKSPSAVPLQKALKAAGYMPDHYAENANYGPRTQAAVAKFHDANPQFKARGVRRDVKIGPKGWAFLHERAYG